jgi:hypothetical protein
MFMYMKSKGRLLVIFCKTRQLANKQRNHKKRLTIFPICLHEIYEAAKHVKL